MAIKAIIKSQIVTILCLLFLLMSTRPDFYFSTLADSIYENVYIYLQETVDHYLNIQ